VAAGKTKNSWLLTPRSAGIWLCILSEPG
jgi:hypothetical protein